MRFMWIYNDNHIVLSISWCCIPDSAKTILSLWKLFLANDLQYFFFKKKKKKGKHCYSNFTRRTAALESKTSCSGPQRKAPAGLVVPFTLLSSQYSNQCRACAPLKSSHFGCSFSNPNICLLCPKVQVHLTVVSQIIFAVTTWFIN